MTDKLLYEQSGHVVTLTFNMPETRNALTDHDLCDAIVEACARMNGDLSVRAAVVTGAGSAFSSGGNLKHMRAKLAPSPATRLRSATATARASNASRGRSGNARCR